MAGGWKLYKGVIHVHTDKSGGAAFDQVLEAARDTDLDFVILTDHGVERQEAEKLEGWHDKVLVLCGEEVYCRDGHFLAFETREAVGPCEQVEYGIEEVRRQVGVVCGTHYHFDTPYRPDVVPAPLPLSSVDVVEAWSFLDEFLTTVPGPRALQFQARPERVLQGPSSGFLRSWDIEQSRRPLPAIGGLNAHLRKEPMLDWREFFPYKVSFKTIRTAIFCPELPKTPNRAKDLVWSAIRQGHSFIYNHSLGDAAGFRFTIVGDKDVTWNVGDEAEYDEHLRVHVALPKAAEIVIRRDSAPCFWGSGEKMAFPVPGPGVFRVEVRLDRRTWILSNAIRVVVPGGGKVRQPTFVDFT